MKKFLSVCGAGLATAGAAFAEGAQTITIETGNIDSLYDAFETLAGTLADKVALIAGIGLGLWAVVIVFRYIKRLGK